MKPKHVNTYPEITSTKMFREAIYAYHDWAAAELGHPLATFNGIYQITAQVFLEALADRIPVRDVIYRDQILPRIEDLESGVAHVDEELGIALRHIANALRSGWGGLIHDQRFVSCTMYAEQRFRKGPRGTSSEYKSAFGMVSYKLAEPLTPRVLLLAPIVNAPGGEKEAYARADWRVPFAGRLPAHMLETSILQNIVSFGRYYAQDLAFGRGKDIAGRMQQYLIDPQYQGHLANLHPPEGPVMLAPEDIKWAWTPSGKDMLARASKDQFNVLPREYWNV